jgi:hypothetical protein
MTRNKRTLARSTALAAICAAAFLASFPGGGQALKARTALSALKRLAPSLSRAVSADAGENNVGNLFRLMTFLIVGFPDEATYTALSNGGDGPPRKGMIGLVNDIMGEQGLGHLFKGKYTSCSELPSSGSDSASTEEGILTVTLPRALHPDPCQVLGRRRHVPEAPHAELRRGHGLHLRVRLRHSQGDRRLPIP